MPRKNVMFMLDPPQPLRLEGALAFAHARNWQVTIASRLLRPPAGWLGDGILVTLRNDMRTTRFVRAALKKGIPVVDLTHHRPDFRVPRVTPDYADTGRTAVGHLTKVGCRSILYFSAEWTHVRQLEYEGIRKARPSVEKVILSDAVPLRRLDDEARLHAVLAPVLRAKEKPLGVITYNDEEAVRVLRTCEKARLSVPDEVAIVGAGNDTLLCENLSIPISSVIDDFRRNGFVAAELLDRIMNGERVAPSPLTIPNLGVAIRRSSDLTAASHPLVRETLRLLAENPLQPPTVDQLAERLKISRSTFDRLFRRELGQSLHDFVLERRLVEAKRLLLDGALSVAEISRRCGFCNPGHFISTFKRATGRTPASFAADYQPDAKISRPAT